MRVRLMAIVAMLGLGAVLAATALAGNTPVGTTLKVGKPATVPYSNSAAPKVNGTIQITPESIVKGSIKDFANVTLTAAQKKDTPFYMKIRTKNVGRTDLSKTDPGRYMDGVDDRGQSQSAIIFFGDFDRCPDPDAPKSLKPGESYETCEAFLMAKGGSIVGAVWVEFDPKHPAKSDVNWRQ